MTMTYFLPRLFRTILILQLPIKVAASALYLSESVSVRQSGRDITLSRTVSNSAIEKIPALFGMPVLRNVGENLGFRSDFLHQSV